MTVRSSDPPSMLILGATGLLGRAMTARLTSGRGESAQVLHCWGSGDLDLRSRTDVLERVGAVRPRVVINAAAYTQVDACESDVERAFAVNAEGAAHVAEACRRVDAFLVHYSTDFVFDGAASEPYRTDAATRPLCVYGRSKLAGEVGVRKSGCRHAIVRTSWLFGPGGKNFVDTIRSRAEKGETLRVVDDQVGSPTFSLDLAEATCRLTSAQPVGVFHFCNAGVCSWHAFACEIVRQSGVDCAVEAINSAALGRPARRPPYSALDTSAYTRFAGTAPRPWQDALADHLRLGDAPLDLTSTRSTCHATCPS